MTMDYRQRTLMNLERLNVLRELALVDSKFETTYDRLTQFASKIIEAPVSLVSMVAADYQFFKSHVGLPDPWKSRRRTPLSHSFCQHVVTSNEPLIVNDARESDLLKNNKAIPDLNVIGYLGFPLTLSTNQSLGSFCVIDGKPREWTEDEIEIMRELSLILTQEFETRAKVNLRQATKEDLEHVQNQINAMIASINTSADHANVLLDIRAFRKELTASQIA
jgi:GAF domain-containing protein